MPESPSVDNVVPEFPCWDCRVNTCPLEGNREYYEVSDEVWHEAYGIGVGYSDNGVNGYFLCIGCLENRLGRKLVRLDFNNCWANNPSPWLSERLNERLGLTGPFASRDLYYQFFPADLLPFAIKAFNPRRSLVEHGGAAILIWSL